MAEAISPNEIIESLKELFEEKNMRFNLRGSEIVGDKKVYAVFEFLDKYGALSEEEFEGFLDLLGSLGFFRVDEAEHRIKDYVLYKELLVNEAYFHSSGDIEVHLKYYVFQSEKLAIYLDRVTVMGAERYKMFIFYG